MRRWLFVLAVLLSFVPLAQGRSYREIDRYALAARPQHEKSLDSLAAYLKAGSPSQEDRARMIYRWVADRIAYHGPTLSLPQDAWPDQGAEAVLDRRSCVCEGYSRLYLALAERCGLEAVQVAGDTRDPPGEADDSGHAWNAVKFGGRWHLLDATWGAGYLTEAGHFQKRFTNYYWDVSPAQLSHSHIPDQDRWQLLAKPRTMKEIEQLPVISTGYFRYQVRPTEQRGKLKTVAAYRFRFQSSETARFKVYVAQNDRYLDESLVLLQKENGGWTADVLFPAPGDYEVRMFGSDDPFSDSKEYVLSYFVKVWRGTPHTFARTRGDVFLEYPRVHRLKAGTAVSFSLQLPNVSGAEVVVGDGRKFSLKRCPGNFYRTTIAALPAGDVGIYADRKGVVFYQAE